MIWMLGQCIRLVLNTRFVDDDELESQKEKGPSGLLLGKFLFCHKIDQICMVRPDFSGITMSLGRHQCFDGLLDPPWTSLGQLVQHPKVSKLPCPQAMSKSSTISSQSNDQQVGKFHKFGKSIW